MELNNIKWNRTSLSELTSKKCFFATTLDLEDIRLYCRYKPSNPNSSINNWRPLSLSELTPYSI